MNQAFTFERLNETEIETLITVEHLRLSLLELSPLKADWLYTLDSNACDNQVGWVLFQKLPEGPAKSNGPRSHLSGKVEPALTKCRENFALLYGLYYC